MHSLQHSIRMRVLNLVGLRLKQYDLHKAVKVKFHFCCHFFGNKYVLNQILCLLSDFLLIEDLSN